MENESMEIFHDREARRFHCTDGHFCGELNYETEGGTTIDIYRTYVDPALRGKGIAQELMKKAVDFAESDGLAVRPTCSFAVSFFRGHDEYRHLLVQGVDLSSGGSCRISVRNKSPNSPGTEGPKCEYRSLIRFYDYL
jgi:predicted GNAT family acetyltransferase